MVLARSLACKRMSAHLLSYSLPCRPKDKKFESRVELTASTSNSVLVSNLT